MTLAPNFTNAHVLVRGEGGAALRQILNHVMSDDLNHGTDAAGICFTSNADTTITKQAFDRSLEVVPSPGFAYDLLPTRDPSAPRYSTNLTRMLGTNPQINICTQSCRARCSFCSTYLIHGRSKSRPLDLIKGDLDHLIADLGHDTIEFHDDDLPQHTQFDQLLDLLAGYSTPWFCFARADTMTGATPQRMADAGCRRVFLGLESMHQPSLDYYNKDTTVTQNAAAVEALAAAGIGSIAGFIIGVPHETLDTVLSSLDAYLALPLFGLSCSILSPDPGTKEFNRARKRGGDLLHVLGPIGSHLVKPDIERFGTQEPAGMPTLCDAISKEELNRLVALVEAAFYFRPHIYRGLIADRTPEQVDRIGAFYDFLADRLYGLDLTRADPKVSARITQLKQTSGRRWWNAHAHA